MFKTIAPLSSIIALRFFGLFIVLPVISVYALSLPGSNSTLVGIIVGGYALTQMIFQIPFGIMSDKLGRKGTIITGLLLFAIGSVICALSDNILTLLLGRFLQGAGAIGAVVTAMISDLVQEEKRPKAMALMGGMIATSFALAMIIAPTMGASLGIHSLFWLTGFLALASIVVLIKFVPNPPKIKHSYDTKTNLIPILLNSNLIKMNITNFLQKGFMTFAFMIIPIILTKTYGWELADLYKVYLPSMIAGILAMAPAAILAEKKGKFKEVLIVGIILFAISYFMIGSSTSTLGFISGVVIFFIGFNMHEPIMQSLATKYAKVHQRGAVLGTFNSFGYLGTFLGGVIGGIYLDKVSLGEITNVIVLISILWAILIVTLPNPTKMKIAYISLSDASSDNLDKLNYSTSNIDEWYTNETENIIVVKYNDNITSEENIRELIK
jgi:predicted MFS family arabinose efflux permease